MGDALYSFLLDFFPLIDEVHAENAVLGAALQQAALSLIDDLSTRPRVLLLLRLSRDLGYVSPEVAQYLERQLLRIARGGPRPSRA